MFKKLFTLLFIVVSCSSVLAGGDWRIKDPMRSGVPRSEIPNWAQVWNAEPAGIWIAAKSNGNLGYPEVSTHIKPWQVSKDISAQYHGGKRVNTCLLGLPNHPTYCTFPPGVANENDPYFPQNVEVVPGWVIMALMDFVHNNTLYVYVMNENVDKWQFSGWNVRLLKGTDLDCPPWVEDDVKLFEVELPVDQFGLASLLIDFGALTYYEGYTPSMGQWEVTEGNPDGVWDAMTTFSDLCLPVDQGDTHQRCYATLGWNDLMNLAGGNPVFPTGKVFWRIINSIGPKSPKMQPKDLYEKDSFGCFTLQQST